MTNAPESKNNPSHLFSNPPHAEGLNAVDPAFAPHAGRAAEQPDPGSGLPSDPLDEELALMERNVQALLQQREAERYWAERRAKQQRLEALRRQYEELQA